MREGEWMDDDDCFQPGYLPLQHAARYGHLEAVSYCLRAERMRVLPIISGHTLGCGTKCGSRRGTARLRRRSNADCLARHFDEALGWHFIGTPLHSAGNNAAMIQTLVNHGAKVDAVELPPDGHDPIPAALGLAEAARALLSLGANPNARCEISGTRSAAPNRRFTTQQKMDTKA